MNSCIHLLIKRLLTAFQTFNKRILKTFFLFMIKFSIWSSAQDLVLIHVSWGYIRKSSQDQNNIKSSIEKDQLINQFVRVGLRLT